jgi:hypothetical protein
MAPKTLPYGEVFLLLFLAPFFTMAKFFIRRQKNSYARHALLLSPCYVAAKAAISAKTCQQKNLAQ